MNDSTQPEDSSQTLQQAWICDACGYQGLVPIQDGEDVMSVVARIVDDHTRVSPDCLHPEKITVVNPQGLNIPRYGENGERIHIVGVSSWIVTSWSEGDVTKGDPVTQVHMLVTVPSLNTTLLLRLKSRDHIDSLIAALISHRDEVFPLDESNSNA